MGHALGLHAGAGGIGRAYAGICAFQPAGLRAVGEHPAAADALGINVYGLRYLYVFIGGLLAGLAGATISLSISPGWFSELTTSGQGWMNVSLFTGRWERCSKRFERMDLPFVASGTLPYYMRLCVRGKWMSGPHTSE